MTGGLTASLLVDRIAKGIGAETYRINSETPYTGKDLDWTGKGSRSTVEMKNRSYCLSMAGPAADLSGYGTVLIGFLI